MAVTEKRAKTILLADDTRSIREFCREELERAGYRVITVRDGWEAIEAVQRDSPDLVVMDMHMPRGTGLEVAQRIKARRPEIPVILFTSRRDDCDGEERAAVAAACLSKSEDLTQLKETIAAMTVTS
ncbi:MAG: response regulator [Thermoguttaceae bacterium]|nr:response regulator [Thermoguttaceae bacterium]